MSIFNIFKKLFGKKTASKDSKAPERKPLSEEALREYKKARIKEQFLSFANVGFKGLEMVDENKPYFYVITESQDKEHEIKIHNFFGELSQAQENEKESLPDSDLPAIADENASNICVNIYSSQHDEIREMIVAKLGHSATFSKDVFANKIIHTEFTSKIIWTKITRLEFRKLQSEVKKIDPNARLTICSDTAELMSLLSAYVNNVSKAKR